MEKVVIQLETAELVARGAREKYHGEHCNHGTE